MFERGISVADVRHIINTGDVIEDYPTDYRFSSRLILGWRDTRPIHVVAADNPATGETLVITFYEPDSTLWDAAFRRRMNP
jgi:hypothetical protein